MEKRKGSKSYQNHQGLNFNAPLMSTRRNGASPVQSRPERRINCAAESDKALNQRSELQKPGRVLFRWEENSGRPKEEVEANTANNINGKSGKEEVPAAAGAASAIRNNIKKDEHVASDDFSDALEALSQSESCTAAWSVSMLSGAEDQRCISSVPSSNSRRIVDRNFMMDRFLPAAKAIASETPHPQNNRRAVTPDPPRPLALRRDAEREPLPLQCTPSAMKARKSQSVVKDFDYDDDDDDVSVFSPKACGIFPWRLKNALCYRSPGFQAFRSKKKKRPPLIPGASKGSYRCTVSDGEALSDSDDDEELTWEAVYRQKIVNSVQSSSGSVSATKRNGFHDFSGNASPEIPRRMSYGSDSQSQSSAAFKTPPQSAGISPYRNGTALNHSPGFLGLPKSDTSPRRRSCNSINDGVSDDLSFWNSSSVLENSSSCNSTAAFKGNDTDFNYRTATHSVKTEPENYISRRNLVASMAMLEMGKETKHSQPDQKPETAPRVQQPSMTDNSPAKNNQQNPRGWPLGISSKPAKTNEKSRERAIVAFSAKPESKATGNGCESPLPPPLPKSPAESWLWRTMPRTPSPNSRLSRLSRSGSPLRKQPQSPTTVSNSDADPKWETIVKSSYTRSGHLRFSQEFNYRESPGSFRSNGP